MEGKMLVKYIKGKGGRRKGVVTSCGYNSVGWSLCNESAGDVFNRDLALKIARGREIKGSRLGNIPYSIYEDVREMFERSRKYFRGYTEEARSFRAPEVVKG